MRKHLVWVLGLALAVGVAGIALAANTHQIKAKVAPQKQDDNRLRRRLARLHDVHLLSGAMWRQRHDQAGDDGSGSTSTTTSRSTPRAWRGASHRIEGTTTRAGQGPSARAPRSERARQGVHRRQPGSAPVAVIVTAFNGQRLGRHAGAAAPRADRVARPDRDPPGQLKTTSGDFGTLIDARVDPLPLNTALTSLQIKVQKSFNGRWPATITSRPGVTTTTGPGTSRARTPTTVPRRRRLPTPRRARFGDNSG